MNSLKTLSLKSYVLIGMISIAVFWLVFVLPITDFIPEYKTESVKIIEKNNDSCIVETEDGFLLTTPSCEGEKGDKITITYDVNKKKFASWITP